ncbi:hypothetical protein ACSBR1_033368 [Camellia fascicularis]
MRFRFPTFHLRCTLENASKTTNHKFSRALTTHFHQDDFFSSNGQISCCGEDIPNPVDPNLLAQLQQHGSVHTPYILNKLISFCAKSSLFYMGIQAHSIVIKMGFNSNVYINSALVDMYGKCGFISCAQQLFDEMCHRNVVTWNSLMSAYLHTQYPEMAIELFLEMFKGKMFPTPISISTALVGCVQLEDGELGVQVHCFCLKSGFCFNVVVCTGLIDMYSKCLTIDASRRVFNEVPDKNVVTWTSLVTGYAQNRQPDEAMILVMEMLRLGVKSSYVTYNILLSSFHCPDYLDHCKQVHCCIIREGLESDMYLTVTLVTVYSECSRSLEDFYRICSTITIWDQVSWNAVISGFSNLGDGRDALICFSKMRQAGIIVDFFTFTSILRATGIISALEVGKQVHCLVIKTRYASNVCVQNAIVSMYARCGEIDNAKKAFLSMKQHDLISWNSLLSGFAHHGYGREAVQMFEQMSKTGVKPDLTTFLAVLSACSHVGLLDKGLEYFDLMKSDESLQPLKLEHYACIVDLYGRAGYLHEAEAFINSMPIEPGPSVFKALLSACKVHGNTEIAVRSARKLVELCPSDPATYVLLASVLANEGYWDNAAETQPSFFYMVLALSMEHKKQNAHCAMAQMHAVRRIDTDESPQTPRARASPTFEQLVQGDASRYPSPTLGKEHGHKEYYVDHNKKSVLSKVKETAQKMRRSLNKKKHDEHEDSRPPSSGVIRDDDEDEDEDEEGNEDDEDPEYLGAPMYESELAPESYKETARQHPRAIPVVSEKHVLSGSVKHEMEQELEKKPLSPDKTITDAVFETIGPAYGAVSGATHTIASKIAGLTIAAPAGTVTTKCADSGTPKLVRVHEIREHGTAGANETWDKGVSVKEYGTHKLEPGEDERALSHPKKTQGDMVEKVREAVTSLLHNEESSQSITRPTNLTAPIPVSTYPQEVIEEENSGRILQAN